MTRMKYYETLEMSLKEATEYEMCLDKKMRKVESIVKETDDFFKVTEKHLRKKYNPDAEDKVIIAEKKNVFTCKPMDVIGYLEDLLVEKEKLKKAVKEASLKKKEVPDIIKSSYLKLQGVLRDMAGCKSVDTEEEMRTDYKLNVNGEQVVYRYKVKGKMKLEYEHEEVLKKLQKLNKKIADKEETNV